MMKAKSDALESGISPRVRALEYVPSFGPGRAEVVRAFDEDVVGLESSANGRGSVYTLE